MKKRKALLDVPSIDTPGLIVRFQERNDSFLMWNPRSPNIVLYDIAILAVSRYLIVPPEDALKVPMCTRPGIALI